MRISDLSRLQNKLAQFFDRRLEKGEPNPTPLVEAVRIWVAANPVGDSILDFLNAGTIAIQAQLSGTPRDEIHVVLLLEGVSQCLDRT
jgi:hypothetical protein